MSLECGFPSSVLVPLCTLQLISLKSMHAFRSHLLFFIYFWGSGTILSKTCPVGLGAEWCLDSGTGVTPSSAGELHDARVGPGSIYPQHCALPPSYPVYSSLLVSLRLFYQGPGR